MATVTGTIDATNVHSAHLVGGDLRTGTLLATDGTHSAYLTGRVVEDTTSIPGGSSFVQDTILDTDQLTLTLFDTTYIDGSYSDSTYHDSTYWEPRLFNPLWVDYSIWSEDRSDATVLDSTLVGYRYRTPVNVDVGYYYANMYSPDTPGDYSIKWQWQRDSASLAHELREPFTVTTKGIDPQ